MPLCTPRLTPAYAVPYGSRGECGAQCDAPTCQALWGLSPSHPAWLLLTNTISAETIATNSSMSSPPSNNCSVLAMWTSPHLDAAMSQEQESQQVGQLHPTASTSCASRTQRACNAMLTSGPAMEMVVETAVQWDERDGAAGGFSSCFLPPSPHSGPRVTHPFSPQPPLSSQAAASGKGQEDEQELKAGEHPSLGAGRIPLPAKKPFCTEGKGSSQTQPFTHRSPQYLKAQEISVP